MTASSGSVIAGLIALVIAIVSETGRLAERERLLSDRVAVAEARVEQCETEKAGLQKQIIDLNREVAVLSAG